MTKNAPTQEQIKEFWEWCGFQPRLDYFGITGWRYPNKECRAKLPQLDLNNLFKYAVPKLEYVNLEKDYNITTVIGNDITTADYRYEAIVKLKTSDEEYSRKESNDPAIALFWAIWEVIHGDK